LLGWVVEACIKKLASDAVVAREHIAAKT